MGQVWPSEVLFGRNTQGKNPISEIIHYPIYSYNINEIEVSNTK